MTAQAKAGLILLTTFLLGAGLGAVTLGAWVGAHRGASSEAQFGPGEEHVRGGGPQGRGPSGQGRRGGPANRTFGENMAALLGPMDSAQRERLRPYFDATDLRNRRIVDTARAAMRAEMRTLRSQVAHLLTRDQLERFDAFVRGPLSEQSEGGPPGLEREGRRGGPPPPPER